MAPRRPPEGLNALPDAFRAFQDGWIEVTDSNQPYSIALENDFHDEHFGQKLRNTLVNMCDNVVLALSRRAKSVDMVTIFEYLVGDSFKKIEDYTTQSLVKKGKAPTSVEEIQQFLATRYLRSRYRLSTEEAFDAMEGLAVANGFTLMHVKRYQQILNALAGYDIAGRSATDSDDVWYRQDRLLQKLHPLEQSFFENSTKLLINRKDGCLVVDDELIASRAGDVELKCVTNRKKGKEGPVADCVVCSLTSTMFGMRLRIQGESQRDNVHLLLDTLGKFNDGTRLIFISFPLLGWMFDDELLARGYMQDNDFPPWVTEHQKKILISRSRLYYAHLKLIKQNNNQPTVPIKVYKHSEQFIYNKGKPGLDKNTELAERLRHTTNQKFEVKYILRMFDALLINTWRCVQAHDLKDWLTQQTNVSTIRNKLSHHLSIDDFAFRFAKTYLRELRVRSTTLNHLEIVNAINNAQVAAPPGNEPVIILSETDIKILHDFEEVKKTSLWPKKRSVINEFHNEPLRSIRLYTSNNFLHRKVRIQKMSVEGRLQCRLCYRPKRKDHEEKRLERQTSYMCSICEVPLCTKPFDHGSKKKSCFERWHRCQDLKRENIRCQNHLQEFRYRPVSSIAEVNRRRALQQQLIEHEEQMLQQEGEQQEQQVQQQQLIEHEEQMLQQEGEQQQQVQHEVQQQVQQQEQESEQQQHTTSTAIRRSKRKRKK